MAADNHIMEALARIEHKLDLVIALDAVRNGKRGLTAIGSEFNCPLCQQPVSYDVDITEGVVLRKCGCKTGKIALSLGAFAPPVLPTRKKDQEDEQRTNEEDRVNPNRRGGPQRR